MKKEFPIIIFILLALIIGGITYVIHNSKMTIDPKRIKINSKGEEEIILNPLEKRYIGKWYLASDGNSLLNMEPKKWEYNRYWKLMDNGKAIYHRPDGRKRSHYWQISEFDSIFSITTTSDTTHYKIYQLGKDNFSAYQYPDKLGRNGGFYVTWKRHELDN
jgi:hypothetical protein